jgi:4-hydroxyphenylpyruvate dioxygenase-like putative hemolysin
MAHSKLKYPIGLLSENVMESIIGGLGLLLNFILVCKANATMFVVKYHSRSILHVQWD